MFNKISSYFHYKNITMRTSGVSFLGRANISSSEDETISTAGNFPCGTFATAEDAAMGADSLGVFAAAGGAFLPAGSLEPEDAVLL
jgi:hypothetical protein